jgi:hypothetical protein
MLAGTAGLLAARALRGEGWQKFNRHRLLEFNI